jgi:hypothetical protein
MKIAICTSFYESARPFLGAYLDGLIAEARDRDIELIAVIDNLVDSNRALERAAAAMPVRVHQCPAGSSIAEVRGSMLRASMLSSAEILVFLDADDVVEVGAIDRHVAALEEADISFGDAQPIDLAGNFVRSPMFEGARIPDRVESSVEIERRNFFGLSNTAMWRHSLSEAACRPPRGNVATDWWLFTTLLDGGRKARRADGVVVRYRMHEANLLGAFPAMSASSLLKRCRIAIAHFEGLPKTEGRKAALVELRRLESAIGENEAFWSAKARELGGGKKAWFEDVFELAEIAKARA